MCFFADFSFKHERDFKGIFTNIFKKQWNIHNEWKNTEFIVNNTNTYNVSTNIYTPIHFECFFNDLTSFNNKKEHIIKTSNKTVSVYANSKLHKEMVKYKIPYTASQINYHEIIPELWNKFYNDIKDGSWPNDVPYHKCNDLPREIKNDIITTHILPRSNATRSVVGCCSVSIDLKIIYSAYVKSDYYINTQKSLIEQEIDLSNRFVINEKLSKVVNRTFDINEIVETKGLNVCQELNIPYFETHSMFVDKWVKLHPPHIQELLLT